MSGPEVVKTELPTGRWHVDPDVSELKFGSRGMFGLMPVHGHFGEFSGALTVDDAGSRGELQISAASLDTHNAKRDEHLKGADFFDVEKYPTLTFELSAVTPGSDGSVTLSGVLRIRENALAITTPVTLDTSSSGQMTLAADLEVDRAGAGVGWNKMGMIQGKAHLSAKVTLTRQD